MAIQPLKDFLLLEPVDASQEGLIYVAEDGTAKIQKGKVVAVGDDLALGEERDYYVPLRSGSTRVVSLNKGPKAFYIDVGNVPPADVEKMIEKVKIELASRRVPRYTVGDIVLYSIYGANEIREGGKKYFLVPDKEVWGKIVKTEV